MRKIVLSWLIVGLFSAHGYAGFDQRDDVAKWLDEAGDVGFTRTEVLQYLSQTKAKPSIVPILRNAPESKLLWRGYQQRLVTPSRINLGRKFLKQHAKIPKRIAGVTGRS